MAHEAWNQTYLSYLQADVPAWDRERVGLEECLRNVFPIKHRRDDNAARTGELVYIGYDLVGPESDAEECLESRALYGVRLELKLEVYAYDVGQDSPILREVKRGSVFAGELPWLTERGSFVAEGREVPATSVGSSPADLERIVDERIRRRLERLKTIALERMAHLDSFEGTKPTDFIPYIPWPPLIDLSALEPT